jgi:hypothetical protein
MGPYFMEFNDSLPDPPRMNSQIWFHRETKVPCVVCNDTYAPHEDRQRYCDSCNKWYHVHCLSDPPPPKNDFREVAKVPIDIEILAENNLPEVFLGVLAGPTVRGHLGSYKFDNNWLNTGSGVQKAMIAEWTEEERLPQTWLKLLGEKFLEDFLVGISWNFYDCPTCGVKI